MPDGERERRLRPPTREEVEAEMKAAEERKKAEEERKRGAKEKRKWWKGVKRGEPEYDLLIKAGKAIAVAIIIAVSILHPITKPLKDFMMEFFAIGIPNIADYWDRAVIFTTLIIAAFAAYWAWRTNSILIGVIWLVSIIIAVIALSLASPALGTAYGGSAFLNLKCTLQNLANPEGMASCQMQLIETGIPEPKKLGSYKALSIRLDTEYTGNVVYKSGDPLRINFDTYFLNLIVENPSDDWTVENFQIKKTGSYIKRSGSVKSKEKIKLANLSTVDGLYMDEYCEDNPGSCNIEPKETLRLTLKADPIDLCSDLEEEGCEEIDVCQWNETEGTCKDGDDRKSKEVEARVKYSYDYAGEGKFDFIVTNSYEVLRALLVSREDPTSSAGPLDVIVYFAPTAYVFRTTPTGDVPINLVIKLAKDTRGNAYIHSPIRVRRLSEGVLTPPEDKKCSSPWGEDLDFSNEELVTSAPGDPPKRLTKSHTYVCEYKIKGGVGEEGEVIPFLVGVDYTDERTITNKYIQVVEIET